MAFEGLHAFHRDDAGKRAQLIQRRRLCRYQQAIEEGVSATDDHGAGSGQALLQQRVLTNDPGMGVIRHCDAGYAHAQEVAIEKGVRVPMMNGVTGR